MFSGTIMAKAYSRLEGVLITAIIVLNAKIESCYYYPRQRVVKLYNQITRLGVKMFTVTALVAAMAVAYYIHEETGNKNYYTSTNSSEWIVSGAGEEFGLEGIVKDGHFEQMLKGFDPRDGITALVQNAGSENRRAGFDFTLSVPKSVSILAEIDPRINEAGIRANDVLIDKLRNEYIYTRQADGENGAMITVQTDNFIVARFTHRLSRELDAQLHYHNVIMNLTKGEDGKYRTIEPRKIYEDQLYLGQIFRNEFAKNLREMGYKIEVTDPQKGLFEIAGVPKDLIEMQSKRRKEVLEQRKENDEMYKVDEEYQALSEAKKMEQAAKDSRKRKPDTSEEEIRQANRKNMEGFLGMPLEKLMEQVLNLPPSPTPQLTAEDYLLLTLNDVMDKQSAFTEKSVITQALKASMGEYTDKEFTEAFKQLPGLELLGTTGPMMRPLYTTFEMHDAERDIVDYAANGIGRATAVIAPKKVMDHLSTIEATGQQSSEGQKDAIMMVLTSQDKLSLIQGDAGAGKTFAMSIVKDICDTENITIRGFAPSGAASAELGKVGIDSMTIDRFLVNKKIDEQIKPGEIWLVDEAGMIGSRKMRRLLQKADEMKAKVVLIGDTKQFQSVEQGRMFQELQQRTKVAKTEITEIKRQNTEAMRNIVKAIKDQKFEKVFEILEEECSLIEIANEEERFKYCVDEYIEDRKKNVESVILTNDNAARNEMNRLARAQLVDNGTITGGGSYDTYIRKNAGSLLKSKANCYNVGQIITCRQDCGRIPKGTDAQIEAIDLEKNKIKVKYVNKDTGRSSFAEIDVKKHCAKYDIYDVVKREFGVGDRVIFTKNDRNVKVSNGQTGVIKEIRDDGTAIITVGKRKVECNLRNRGDKRYTHLDYAYCITNHKSQGASYDKVIVNADVSKQRTNYNAFYVQLTRARSELKIVTNNIDNLKEQVQVWQEKASTLDWDDLGNTFNSTCEAAIQAKNDADMANVNNISEMLDAHQKAEQEKKIAAMNTKSDKQVDRDVPDRRITKAPETDYGLDIC